EKSTVNNLSAPQQLEIEENIQPQIDIDLSSIGKSSKNPRWERKKDTQITLLFSKSKIDSAKFLDKTQGQVLGISTIKHLSNSQIKTESEKSKLFNQLWKKINSKLNKLILNF
ncbi:MAG: hypothetical protein WA019_06920, partial [Candidatus Moraniibacteriota bacterium]